MTESERERADRVLVTWAHAAARAQRDGDAPTVEDVCRVLADHEVAMPREDVAAHLTLADLWVAEDPHEAPTVKVKALR